MTKRIAIIITLALAGCLPLDTDAPDDEGTTGAPGDAVSCDDAANDADGASISWRDLRVVDGHARACVTAVAPVGLFVDIDVSDSLGTVGLDQAPHFISIAHDGAWISTGEPVSFEVAWTCSADSRIGVRVLATDYDGAAATLTAVTVIDPGPC
jgi:hypothetical protein